MDPQTLNNELSQYIRLPVDFAFEEPIDGNGTSFESDLGLKAIIWHTSPAVRFPAKADLEKPRKEGVRP
jgi:hypothetical protein